MSKRPLTKTDVFISIACLILIAALIGWLIHVKRNAYFIKYRNNIKSLQRSFQQYAADFGGHYPSANTWCDFLIKYAGVRSEHLVSSWAGDPMFYDTNDPCSEPNFPVKLKLLLEDVDSQGQHHYSYIIQWCHFAFNPNAKPNSPGDVVLLFSTKGGWNQFGGPETFSSDNYKEIGRIGGYVLFNNGDIKFVKPDEVLKLNWGKSN